MLLKVASLYKTKKRQANCSHMNTVNYYIVEMSYDSLVRLYQIVKLDTNIK